MERTNRIIHRNDHFDYDEKNIRAFFTLFGLKQENAKYLTPGSGLWIAYKPEDMPHIRGYIRTKMISGRTKRGLTVITCDGAPYGTHSVHIQARATDFVAFLLPPHAEGDLEGLAGAHPLAKIPMNGY